MEDSNYLRGTPPSQNLDVICYLLVYYLLNFAEKVIREQPHIETQHI
jgi:hypothetical protein